MESYQREFETLVKNPDKPNSGDNLKKVALALWYDDFVPDVNCFEGKEAAQAGYLLDKLTRYNCLDASKKALVRTQLLAVLESKKQNYSSENHSKDVLVKHWGAGCELKMQFRDLLPYQRRSYQSSRSAA